jgi:hypothetical protein
MMGPPDIVTFVSSSVEHREYISAQMRCVRYRNIRGERCRSVAIVATTHKLGQDTKKKRLHFNPREALRALTAGLAASPDLR